MVKCEGNEFSKLWKKEDVMWHNLEELEDSNSSISSYISLRITV